MKEKPSPVEIKEYIEDQLNLADNLFWLEDGSQIDILIAYSRDAADWAQRNGLNIGTEIYMMLNRTNNALADSGINT